MAKISNGSKYRWRQSEYQQTVTRSILLLEFTCLGHHTPQKAQLKISSEWFSFESDRSNQSTISNRNFFINTKFFLAFACLIVATISLLPLLLVSSSHHQSQDFVFFIPSHPTLTEKFRSFFAFKQTKSFSFCSIFVLCDFCLLNDHQSACVWFFFVEKILLIRLYT